MKAIVLAGGLGSRAKPFTDYSPKPMLPVLERPLVDHIVRYICTYKAVDGVVIATNLTSRGMQIRNYFEGKEGDLGKPITFVNDADEGTVGALLKATQQLKDTDTFLVWFSDNLCPLDIERFLAFYQRKRALGCLAVSRRKREETGFVKVDAEGKVLQFQEKPMLDLPLPECLGIYLFSHQFVAGLKRIRKEKLNLSVGVLQRISSSDRFYAYDIGETPWIDVESPVKIERNIGLVKEIVRGMQRVIAKK